MMKSAYSARFLEDYILSKIDLKHLFLAVTSLKFLYPY